MSDKPDSICPPGIVLTAAQANAMQYSQGAMYHRSSGLNSDPGWEAKRDAGLGITPLSDGVTVDDSAPGMSVITEVKTSDSGFTSITKSYESDPPLVVGSVIPDKKSDESSWLAHALKSMTGKETDPNGLAPHAVGAKLDSGKNRLGLVLGDFANALEQVGWVGTGGAKKYTPHGWMSVDNGTERYTDAMLRHIIKHCKGEKVDPDTKLLHLAHAAWNSLALLELELRKSIPAR